MPGIATLIIHIVLVASLVASQHAAVQQEGASCEVESPSEVSRSSSGIAQVSNLRLIHMQARVSRRPVPSTGVLRGLKVDVTVYQVSGDHTQKMVPSAATVSGGGAESQWEYVYFTLDIPVDPSERDAAIREFIARVAGPAGSSGNEKERASARTLQAMAPQALTQIFRQHRVGRVQVDCRVLDEGHVIGIGRADLEVLFKGRFFDQDTFRKR